MVFLPHWAHAQSNGDGTIYSRFGLGELSTFASPQMEAMGGGGTALRSLNYTSFSNPALWSDQVLTRFVIGATYRQLRATDGTGAKSTLNAGTLNGVQLSFPLYTRTLGFAVSYHPYSQMNYRVVRRSDAPLQYGPSPDDTTGYRISYEGRGGLQQVNAGLGWRVADALSVGASVDFIFGILEEGRRTTIQNRSGAVFAPVNFTDATRLSGITGTLGARLALDRLLGMDDALTLGSSFVLPTTLDGRRVRTIGESLERDTIGTTVQGAVELPWRARFGLAYKPDATVTLVADGLYEPWTNFESSFDGTGIGPTAFPAGGAAALTDRWRASAGFEYFPAGTDAFASFLYRTAYRLGASYEQTYVAPSGEPINVMTATAGLSLPTTISGTRLDLDFKVGSRGTTNQNLVRDMFYGVSIHVNIGERWFQERKLR